MFIDSEKPIFMFSGQGSQKVGMGKELIAEPLLADTLSCASDIFGFDVATLMIEGPSEVLNDTRYAQAAILCLSIGLNRILMDQGIQAAASLGFSLGQVSALYASGMLSLEETMRFAHFRAEAMARAAQQNPGRMCALLGADPETALELCNSSAQEEVLVVANYNCPGQIVLSGSIDAIARAQDAWSAQKKRSTLLATSGAFHSPLMQDAACELEGYLENVEFQTPRTALICNTDAETLEASWASVHLAQHLTRPVLFQQSVENLKRAGARTFIELGYGGVLISLVKRIDKESSRINIESAASLAEFLSEQKGNCG